MTIQTPFSKWLDEQLLRNGLTGKDFAKLIGVSEATVSRIRTGKKPLSARMRSLLSQGLKVELREIPNTDLVVNQGVSLELPVVHILRSAIPDHALLNYCREQGIFARNGVVTSLMSERDAGRHFPKSYVGAIEKNTENGNFVLVMGPGTTLEKYGAIPNSTLFSHTYKGYAFIARATANLTSLESIQPAKRIFELKNILENLVNYGMWRSQNLARFSWISEMDYHFIDMMRGLSQEMQTGEKYQPAAEVIYPEKSGIDCLHDIGDYGADIAVADAGSLGRAYTQLDKYSVIFTLEQLISTISSMSELSPPSWAPLLRKAYYADKVQTAVERFKAFWLSELSRLESAIGWHLFVPECADGSTIGPLMHNLQQSKQDLEKTIGTPDGARNVMRWVRDYIQEHLAYDDTLTEMDAFERAWRNCYSGL